MRLGRTLINMNAVVRAQLFVESAICSAHIEFRMADGGTVVAEFATDKEAIAAFEVVGNECDEIW